MRLIHFTAVVLLSLAQLAVLVSGDVTEQRSGRRPLFRRVRPTSTTSEPAAVASITDDSEGSETKHQRLGSDPFSVTSNQQPGTLSGSIKADGDKLTPFSEYGFGNHAKLSDGSQETSSDGDTGGYTGFKNHKSAVAPSLLPTTNANKKDRKTERGAFDFFARDYAKAKGTFGDGGLQLDTAAGLLGTKSKTPSSSLSSATTSSVSSKFSISHPSPIIATGNSKAAGKLAHLDDSTEYDVYASLAGHSAKDGKPKLGASGKYRPLVASSSLSSSDAFGATGAATSHFEGKVKKVPFKYEDGGLGAATTLKGKTKSKLAVVDDKPFGTVPGLDGTYGAKPHHHHHHHHEQQQQQQNLFSTKGKFNFAEPPALVKSTLNTLKHFGDGLLGNGNVALIHSPNPYDLDSNEGGGGGAADGAAKTGSPGQVYGTSSHFGSHSYPFGSPVGAGQPAVEESYEVVSGELDGNPRYQHHKSPIPPLSGVGKFATDFDVKNIKLTDGAVFGGHTNYQGAPGGSSPGHLGKNTPQHHTKLHQQQHQGVGQAGPPTVTGHIQGYLGPLGHPGHHHLHQQQQQQQQQQLLLQQQHAPHHAHATHGTGAGIAAKGKLESLLNSEHGLKDESLVGQLLGQQSDGAGRPHYHTLQKSKEEDQLEKEALRQQIEYLKAQAAKRPVDLSPSNPARPAIVSNAQKFRPVRRIPPHVRLGVKTAYPLPRIPHYNDRPYSISFKI